MELLDLAERLDWLGYSCARPYDRLDEVANYYRFRPQNGELWPTTPAKAYAVVEGGKVTRVVVTEPGSGYNTPPSVTVEGVQGVAFKVTRGFSKDVKANGGVAAVEIPSAK